LSQLAKQIEKQRPDAIALSLLFSFANPENEKLVAAELKRLEIPISVSHEILPEFREYERASTVVINAYLQPVMAKYLNNVSGRLSKGKQRASVFVMQLSGGLTSLETAAREPVRTVLSGPAGGVVGAARWRVAVGIPNHCLRYGRDFDGCVPGRRYSDHNQRGRSGWPTVRVPMLNIHTVVRAGDRWRASTRAFVARGAGIRRSRSGADLLWRGTLLR